MDEVSFYLVGTNGREENSYCFRLALLSETQILKFPVVALEITALFS